MLDLIAFLISSVVTIWLFIEWRNEERRKVHLGSSSGSITSEPEETLSQYELDFPDSNKQVQRYQQSSLFAVFGSASTSKRSDSLTSELSSSFRTFVDRFTSLSDVSMAIQRAGLTSCELIVGVDFTASNDWQGIKTFSRQNLHTQLVKKSNPYQKVLAILGATLEPFSETHRIFAYGFGDEKTRDRSVFPFHSDESPCLGFKEVLQCYNQIARTIRFAGPTCFSAMINKAVEIVSTRNAYHILVIISDGQMRREETTIEALVRASYFPLSIIMVGVGDGPWGTMEKFDDLLPQRKFDNFQFVDYNRAQQWSKRNTETVFALHALMEIADQFKSIRDLKLL